MAKLYDFIIVGAGPAGLTAGIYGARAGLKTLVLKDKNGSNLMRVPSVHNLLGFPNGLSGPDVIKLGEKHAKKYGAEIRVEEVLRCVDCDLMPSKKIKKEFKDAKIIVHTQLQDYGAKNLLIAAGMQIRSAGIENEFKLIGRGVAVCVACDGPMFKKKKVMVVGAGDLAASEAIELLAHTDKVMVNLNGARSKMSDRWKKLLKKNNIELISNKVAKVVGPKWVTSVEFMDGTKEKIDGLFLSMGTASAIDFAKSLGLEMEGQVLKVTREGRTNVESVWAAGDIIGPPRQIGKSMGDAVRATIDIIEKTRGGSYVDHRED